MIDIFEIKKFYIIIFVTSLLSLLIALYIEFFLGYPPCKLCIYQRIPYLISIFITFLGISYSKKLIWLYALLITFFSSFLLSGYHFGIEKEIFSEFSGCTNNSLDITDKSKILESLSQNMPSCKEINIKIFGLSLATINFMISLTISAINILIIKNEKNR